MVSGRQLCRIIKGSLIRTLLSTFSVLGPRFNGTDEGRSPIFDMKRFAIAAAFFILASPSLANGCSNLKTTMSQKYNVWRQSAKDFASFLDEYDNEAIIGNKRLWLEKEKLNDRADYALQAVVDSADAYWQAGGVPQSDITGFLVWLQKMKDDLRWGRMVEEHFRPTR